MHRRVERLGQRLLELHSLDESRGDMSHEPRGLKKVADFGYESIFTQKERSRKVDQLNSVYLNTSELYVRKDKEHSKRAT